MSVPSVEPVTTQTQGTPKGSRAARKEAFLEASTLIAAQYGVITRRQLIACGVSERQIDRRAQEGHLRVVARGMFVVSCPATWERSLFVAQLYTAGRNDPAVLSHRTAGALLGLDGCRRGGGVELTSVPSDRHPNPFAMMHRAGDLIEGDVVVGPLGLPMTSPVRTVLDLALESTRFHDIESVVMGAVNAGVIEMCDFEARLACTSKRSGIVQVRKAVRRLFKAERQRLAKLEHQRQVEARREARRLERKRLKLEAAAAAVPQLALAA